MIFAPGAFGGDGAVAVAYGNPDTADHTSINVPGLQTNMNGIGGVSTDAYNVFKSASASNTGSVASIAWIGYNAPDINSPTGFIDTLLQVGDVENVAMERFATAGGHHLSSFVDGLRASDVGDQSHLTVIGHSYGSTTVGHAATDDGLAADDIILAGSPGAGDNVYTASQLGDNVWVGASDNDPVSWLGRRGGEIGLGMDPTNECVRRPSVRGRRRSTDGTQQGRLGERDQEPHVLLQ